MSAKQSLKELAVRKQLLVMQADLHRHLIGLECSDLRERFGWLCGVREHLASGSPLLVAGGLVTTVLAARHWRTLARWIPGALAAWRWLRRLKTG